MNQNTFGKSKWMVSWMLLTSSLVWAAPIQAHVKAIDPYVAAVPPTSKNTACYLTLKNTGQEAVRLVSASSPVADAVETHHHIHQNGMMKMEKVESLEVPAGKEVQLKPMGYHLMMFGLKKEFRSAKNVKLILNFSDGSSLKLTAPIKKDE